jgi:hypothetical protein
MSSSYYQMQDAKVKIAHRLMNTGWEVYGYHKDESDSMTDYYSPAYWNGVATKNGYVLCVDVYSANDGKDGTIAHLAHPTTSKWHIEKDGIILDKGTGITKFRGVPNDATFDFETMSYKKGYNTYSDNTEKTLTVEQLDIYTQFHQLMQRFEKVVSGESTNGMKKITVNISKIVIKPTQIIDRQSLLDGDIVTINNYSGYWKHVVDNIHTAGYYFILLGKKWETLSTNSQGTTKYFNKPSIDKGLITGHVKIFKLEEVEEITPTEKWVKSDTVVQEETKTEETQINNNYSITEDIDTRDDSKIWVVKIIDRLSTDEYKTVSDNFKTLKGYYSKFKHGFIFKYDPSDVLNNAEIEEQEEDNSTVIEETTITEDKDILSKFDDVEVTNNSRITEDDETFCKVHENQYKEFISFANKYIDFLENNKLENKYFYSYTLREEMFKKMSDRKCSFIEAIIEYFRKEYKVTLTSEPINKKYDIHITYDMIINEIIEQLGGYNFKDKASNEIKDALKKQVKRGYNDVIKATVKNQKIVLDDFFWIDSFDKKYGHNRIGYNYKGGFYKLLTAISHFEQGVLENYYQGIYNKIDREENDDVFKEHTMLNIKAESMKLFKNGKVEVTFKTHEYARQFAKEYCGCIEKIA